MKRAIGIVNLTVFVVSVLAIAVVVNYFGQLAEMRSRIDATKTRAYSLSEQTRNLLRDLDGEWTIALIMIQSETDRAVRRQIDEVLARFSQASRNISVVRVDPTHPRTLGEYERVLADLRSRYADLVQAYDVNLDAATVAFRDVMVFSQQQAGMMEQLIQLAQTQADFDARQYQPVIQRSQTLGLIADQGQDVLDEVERARRVNDSRPIPDYETARSILVQALSTAADELYETHEAFSDWLQLPHLTAEIRNYVSANRLEHERRARALAVTFDPLRHLPPLELSSIGQQLATGEAALILSPDRAAVIASSQLFPRSNIRRDGTGLITFDQRFRGETLIAAAMRSLMVEHMPMVVFVHAEEGSWLRQRDRQIDLFGSAAMLQAARFDVREWSVGSGGAHAERPTPQRGQRVVWVPIPPPQRSGIELSRRESQLIEQVRGLIADGESVLLSMYPSMLPRYGQVDPWATLGAELGLKINTGRVIYESMRTSADQTEVLRSQSVQQYVAGHPIASAVHGQQTHFALPMVIEIDPVDSVSHMVLATVAPAGNRWLESNWSVDPSGLPAAQPEQRFNHPQPILVAASRPHPIERGEQRVLAVGSGGWMLTYIADAVTGLGGERYALLNPGNHELMLASVAWLSGMDELIAQSPAGQEVARLGEISESASQRWFWLIVVIMPAGCLALGLVVWGVRRN